MAAVAETFTCVAWYNDVDDKIYRKVMEQQSYDKDYYEADIKEMTYGMLFSNREKYEPGFIIYDNSTENFMTADGAMKQIPNTVVSTASAHFYKSAGEGKRIVAQVSCSVE